MGVIAFATQRTGPPTAPWVETFTGANGSLPNTNDWRIGAGDDTYIQNNKVRTNIPAGNTNAAACISLYEIENDFEIYVDYDVIARDTDDWWSSSLRIKIDNSHLMESMYVYDGTQYVMRGRSDIGGGLLETDVVLDLQTGKFKITRTGSNWQAYYYNSGWISIGTVKAVGSGKVTQVMLWTNLGSAMSSPLTVDFDNFTINSGTII